MKSLIVRFVVMTVAILVAGSLNIGFHVTSLTAGFVAAVVLSLLNTIVRPILILLTLPINILTLGIFYFVINALLLLGTARLVNGVTVDNFGSAFLGALVISIVATVLHLMVGDNRIKDR